MPSLIDLRDAAGLGRGGGDVIRPQVQDQWGRSPSDPNYGRPPQPGETQTSIWDLPSGAYGGYNDDWFGSQGAPTGPAQPLTPGVLSGPPADPNAPGMSYGNDVRGTDLGAAPPTGAALPPGYAGMASRMDPDFAFRLGLNPGDLQTDPGYQFRLQQGQQAIERSAAAKGTLLSGGTLKGLERYGQGVASDEYQRRYARLLGEQQNRYGQLFGLSQLGQQSAAGQAGQNQGYANSAGDLMTQMGNAGAAGTIGGANAWNQAIGQGTNLAQMYYLSKLFNPTAPTQPGPYASGYVYPPTTNPVPPYLRAG